MRRLIIAAAITCTALLLATGCNGTMISAGNISGALDVSQPDGLSHLYALKAQGSGLTTFKPLPKSPATSSRVREWRREGRGAPASSRWDSVTT